MPLSSVVGAQSIVKPGVCTTATRPASPYTGQMIYDTTVATTLVWSGSAWIGSAGKVLQVVTGTTSTTVTNNTSTLADTGLTVTITPTSSTSKILVLLAQNGCLKTSGNAGSSLQLLLFRGVTQIAEVAHYAGYTGTSLTNIVGTIGSTILDSPASTSALTYKTQFCNLGANAAGVSVNDTSLSTITVMEISA